MTVHRQHVGITQSNGALTVFVLQMGILPGHDFEFVSSRLGGERCGELRPILDRVVVRIEYDHAFEPHEPWVVAGPGVVLLVFVVAPADLWEMRAVGIPVCVLDLESGLIIQSRAYRIWVTWNVSARLSQAGVVGNLR